MELGETFGSDISYYEKFPRVFKRLKTLRIGLTGGIGSGKSTVAKIFAEMGIPVYDSDTEARRITNEDPRAIRLIKREFGEDVYSGGELDRRKMAAIVFGDKEKLKKLNDIVHPAAGKHWKKWASEKTEPYVIREIAILFEVGAEKDVDFVIGVKADKELRIERVMKRNNLSREEVLKRIDSQMEEEEKMSKCDFLILNNGENLNTQIAELHKKLTS